MNIFKKSKEFYLNNRHKITPAVNFVGSCVEELTKLPESPSMVNYVNLGFRVKQLHNSAFRLNKTDYFLNPSWEPFLGIEIRPVIVGLVEMAFRNQIIPISSGPNNTNSDIFIANLGVGKIGWIGTEHHISSMFVETGKEIEVKKLLSQVVWQRLGMKCLVIDIIKKNYWDSVFILDKHQDHANYVSSKLSDKYTAIMGRYRLNKIGRSMLFYGTPGSGKSIIVRVIANKLELRTVRIQNLENIRNQAISEVIDIFNPDAIVLEDIDHLYSGEVASLLEKIENFNKLGKYVLATANQINKINSALLRPGRFDELVEVQEFDEDGIRELIDDEEIFNKVKQYPIAYVMEVKKRLDMMGREETLRGLGDIEKRVEKAKKEEYKL